jgi:hypothetical protein
MIKKMFKTSKQRNRQEERLQTGEKEKKNKQIEDKGIHMLEIFLYISYKTTLFQKYYPEVNSSSILICFFFFLLYQQTQKGNLRQSPLKSIGGGGS